MNSGVEIADDGSTGSGRTRMVPPFSPVLLGGLLLKPLPPVLLQPVLTLALDAVARHHPAVFERLGAYADTDFLIDPVDLPFRLLLRPTPERPRLTVASPRDAAAAGATIRGSLLALIELLEGRLDGDALFFSRRLLIEGDTEAVVALRNAVDGEEIDLVDDVLARSGPLARPARHIARRLRRLARRANDDVALLQAALLQPALERTTAQAGELDQLRRSMADAARSRGRRPAGRAGG